MLRLILTLLMIKVKIATISAMSTRYSRSTTSCITFWFACVILHLLLWARGRIQLSFGCLAPTSWCLMTVSSILVMSRARCLYGFLLLGFLDDNLLLEAYLLLTASVLFRFTSIITRISSSSYCHLWLTFSRRWIGAHFRYMLIWKTGGCLDR